MDEKNNSVDPGQLTLHEFIFWNVPEIMNNSGLLQSKCSPKLFTLTLQETQIMHDC